MNLLCGLESVGRAFKGSRSSLPSHLTLPVEGVGFTVYCDAFGVGLVCVLTLQGRVIVYASRQLRAYEDNYLTHDLRRW